MTPSSRHPLPAARGPLLRGIALACACSPLAAQIHVDADATGANDGSSWQDAYVDLQDALAAAAIGDEVWLAEGVYRPSATGDRSASFQLPSGVTVYGGFAGGEGTLEERQGSVHATVLSGDLNGDDGPDFTHRTDNSVHVVFVEFFGSGRLDRVTVRGGQADLAGSDLGGGLFSELAPDRIAVDCVFTDNFARRGGGAYVTGAASFHGCTFLGNRALEAGGGVAALPFQSAAPYLDRCRFLGNEVVGPAGEGGGLWGGYGDVFSSEFSGNRAPVGGGLSWSGEAWGITVHGNAATDATGGAVINYSLLRSSILWGNRDPSGVTETAQVDAQPGLVNECCIQGWTGAMGGSRNLGGEPMFVDPRGADGVVGTPDDDLALRRGSPCIDRGHDIWWLPSDTLDLRGERRSIDCVDCGEEGVVDMGAIERQQVDGSTNYCSATPSSLGVPATLSSPCVLSLFLDPVLELRAAPVPDGFGTFVVGPQPSFSPLGDGLLCVSAPQRIALAPAAGGVLAADVDLARPPAADLLVPGSTWFVQALYRDANSGGASFNLSDAASLEMRD